MIEILNTNFDSHQRSPSLIPSASRAIQIVKEIMSIPQIDDRSESDTSVIENCLIKYVDLSLSAPKGESGPASSVLDLILALCSQQQVEMGGLVPSLDFLLYRGLVRLSSKDDLIRARATTLISDTVLRLAETSSDSLVDEDTFQLTREALLPRLNDKATAVRTAAIKACKLLQDSDDSENDQITKQLMICCMHDTSPVCRAAATEALIVTRFTLPTIVCRVRDTSYAVRVAALEILKSQVDVRLMTDTERVVVLRSGLTPRCPQTYNAASKMLCCGWLKSLGYSPLKLFKLLDVANNEGVCELAAKAILAALNDSTLKELSANEVKAYKAALNKQVEVDNLTVQSALLLRMKCSEIKDDETLNYAIKAELMDEIMPDTPVICSSIQKHLGLHVSNVRSHDDTGAGDDDEDDSDDSFICLQLLKLARSADFSEESGKQQCLSMLHNMLCSAQTPDELVESCIRAMAVAHTSETDYVERVNEVIVEVSDYDAEDEEMDANDAAFRQLRIVSIIGVVLEHTKRNHDDAVIAKLEDHILPALASADSMVREAGVSCLGKYAMLGAEAAEQYKPLLLSIVANSAETSEIRAQALLAMCDLAMLWDGMMGESDCTGLVVEDAAAQLSLESLLENVFDAGSGGMIVIAAEIFSKLLLMGRIKNSEMVLAKLLMIYFDPKFASFVAADTEKEIDELQLTSGDVAAEAQKELDVDAEDATEVGSPIRLQQLLSMFFPAFCMLGPDRRQIMGSCTKNVLELFNTAWTAGGEQPQKASKKSSKKRKAVKAEDKVSLERVLTFIANEGNQCGCVAREICDHIVSSSEAGRKLMEDNTLRDMMKTLSVMNIVDIDDANLIRDMVGDVSDATSEAKAPIIKNWDKFVDHVEAVLEIEEKKTKKSAQVVHEEVVNDENSEEVVEVVKKGKKTPATKAAATKKTAATSTKSAVTKPATTKARAVAKKTDDKKKTTTTTTTTAKSKKALAGLQT
jgi:hypothetical protein